MKGQMITKEMLELGVHLARSQAGLMSVHKIVQDTIALGKLGRRAVSIATAQCNYMETDKAEKLRVPVRAKAQKIAKEYGLTAIISGDPRGYCLKLKGLPGNTWGGDEEGFGIC